MTRPRQTEREPDRLMESLCCKVRDVIVIARNHDGEWVWHDTFEDADEVIEGLERYANVVLSEDDDAEPDEYE
jgi:hypothetical protein